MSSGETHGSPAWFLAIPSRYLITWSESRCTELWVSDCEPSRRSKRFKGWPVAESEVCNPCARAMSTTNTATVRVMLKAVMRVVVRRTARLRRLYFKGIAIGTLFSPVAPVSNPAERDAHKVPLQISRCGGAPPRYSLWPPAKPEGPKPPSRWRMPVRNKITASASAFSCRQTRTGLFAKAPRR